MPTTSFSVPARAVLVAVGWLVILFGTTASVPFLSEDWTQMELARGFESIFGAMDLAREPLRPLQHAFVWCLAHCGLDPAGSLPTTARGVGFALFAVACGALALLAREAGLGPRGVGSAVLLAVAFPNVKALSWSAAIGSPGRVAFELVALLFLVRRARGGPAWHGVAGVAAFVLALGFHESASLLPAILLAWLACVGAESLRQGLQRAISALRDPYVLATCAIAAVHVLHLAFFRPGRVHGAQDLASLPANVAKALLALAPECVREIGIEGLRGHRGMLGAAAACVVIATVLVVFVLAFRRGRILRFASVAIALDLGLAAGTAGFVQRYAILASAFAALGLAAWVTTRGRFAFVAVLGATWMYDAHVDAREIRDAGRGALTLAGEVRGLSGSGPLAVVGVPGLVGAEGDVPYFNWGGTIFLRAHGVTRPVTLLRERVFATNSDQDLVDDDGLRELGEKGVELRRWQGFESPLTVCPP